MFATTYTRLDRTPNSIYEGSLSLKVGEAGPLQGVVCKGINCEPEFAGHYYPRNSPHSSYNAVQLIHNASHHHHRRSALARHRRNRTDWGRLYTLCDAEQARHPGNGLCHLPWWRKLHNHSKSANRARLLGAWRKCLSHILLCCWQ